MSYCRWSDDGGQCDLYCYQSGDGLFVTHVAAFRHTKRVCDIDYTSAKTIAKTREQRERDYADPENKRIPIGLIFAGAIFYDASLEDLLARLRLLRGVGYRFPDTVLRKIKDELASGRVTARLIPRKEESRE